MKWKLIVILSVFCWFHVTAQEFVISLENRSLNFERFPFYVEDIIDVRPNKNCVGFVMQGVSNERIPIFFETSAENEFERLFEGSRTLAENGDTFLLKINHLWAYEYSAMTSNRIVEMNIGFIQKREGKLYYLFDAVASVDTDLFGVNRFPTDNIFEVLRSCLRDFKWRYNSNLYRSKEVSHEELIQPTVHEVKILELDHIPNGIFPSIYDFQNGFIDTTRAFFLQRIHNKEGQLLYAKADWVDDKTPVKNRWGLYHFGQFFVNVHSNKFIPFEVYEDQIQIENCEEIEINESGAPKAAVAAGVIGGLFGGLIGGAIAGGIAGAVASGKNDLNSGCSFDPSTGRFQPEWEKQLRKIQGNAYLYFTSYSKEGMEVTVEVDGVEQCTLTPGSYYWHKTFDDSRQVELCVVSGEQRHCELISTHLFSYGIYLLKVRKRKSPKIDLLKREMEDAIAEEIKEGQLERKCPD